MRARVFHQGVPTTRQTFELRTERMIELREAAKAAGMALGPYLSLVLEHVDYDAISRHVEAFKATQAPTRS